MTTTAAIITRARREATVTTAVGHVTLALRGIATGRTPPADARKVAQRYCRALGISAAAIDDPALAFLSSDGATVLRIEELDAWLCEHASATAAAAAIQRAHR